MKGSAGVGRAAPSGAPRRQERHAEGQARRRRAASDDWLDRLGDRSGSRGRLRIIEAAILNDEVGLPRVQVRGRLTCVLRDDSTAPRKSRVRASGAEGLRASSSG
jgi:hypothetical protein